MSEFEAIPIDVPQRDPRENLAKRIALIFGAVSLVLGLIATSLFATSSGSSDFGNADYTSSLTADDSAIVDDSWVPTGFTVWDNDSNVAWKWSDTGDYQCGTYTCIEAQFISRDGCNSSFYAAVNWFDKPASQDGSVIGYDNASLPALFSMQVAKIQFEDTSDSAKSGQISEIDCR